MQVSSILDSMRIALTLLAGLYMAFQFTACADLLNGPFHHRDDDDDSTHYQDTTGNGNDTTHTGGGDTTKVDTTVCFSRDILPILVSNCAMAKCHDAISHKEGLVLTSYESALHLVSPGNPTRSELYKVITTSNQEDLMPPPPGKLSSAQIELIARWIREGAKNRDCSNDSPCNTSNVTYSNTIAPMMEKWCTGCHGANQPSAGINLTDRATVVSQASQGFLLGTVSHASGFVPMPPSGPKMDDCSIAQIKAWIDTGLK